jgi:hypothetical protein
MGMNSIVQFHA